MSIKKTITITAHNRPEYFAGIIDSLLQGYSPDWSVHVSIEPTDRRDELIEIAQKAFPDVELFLPKVKYGVRRNPFAIMDHVFEYHKSDFNLYLEEDITIAPDVCRLADWYIENTNHESCLCLCNLVWTSGSDLELLLSDFDDRIKDEPPESLILSVDQFTEAVLNQPMYTTFSTGGFSALVIVLSKNFWLERMKPVWFSDGGNINGKGGWDWSVASNLVKNDIKVLIPYESRSDHVGIYGVHARGNNPEFQQRDIIGCHDYKNIEYKIWKPTKGYAHR